jgi:hypothetical protein
MKLRLNGFGPDILHLVSQDALANSGIIPGDAICLREYAPKWWNSSVHAKRMQHTPSQSSTVNAAQKQDATTPNKHICFEKHYYEGGKYIIWGSKLIAIKGPMPPNPEFQWHYHLYELDAVIPIPDGYVPMFEDND